MRPTPHSPQDDGRNWGQTPIILRNWGLTPITLHMECADRSLLDVWMSAWADLVDFEVHPVISSAEAAEAATRSNRARA